jgi:hypothetical protein
MAREVVLRTRAQSLVAVAAAVSLALAGARSGRAGSWSADDPLAAAKAAVVEVVDAAYVDGIHNFRDPVAIRKGFHPGFEMLVLKNGQLEKLPIEKWIEAIEARNAKEPPPADGKRTTTAAFPLVEVTGSAAVVKVELTRDGKLVFTDYLSLYQFEDGWKIVGKIFFRHPSD